MLIWFDLKKKKSKYLATTRLKQSLTNLIDARQLAYFNDIFIGEGGSLMNHVIKFRDLQKK